MLVPPLWSSHPARPRRGLGLARFPRGPVPCPLLALQAARARQPAPREALPAGAGPGHLPGPAPHCADCHPGSGCHLRAGSFIEKSIVVAKIEDFIPMYFQPSQHSSSRLWIMPLPDPDLNQLPSSPSAVGLCIRSSGPASCLSTPTIWVPSRTSFPEAS